MEPEQVDGGALLPRWRRSMVRLSRSPATIRNRMIYARSWLAFIGPRWTTATWREVEAWLDAHPRWSVATQAVAVAHVRAFYRWAQREELVMIPDPTLLVERPRLPAALPRPATDADWRRAMATLEDPWRLAVVLAGGAGLRCMEIARLEWPDVNLADASLRVVQGKGRKDRVTGIIPQAVAELARYDAVAGPVLGRVITRHQVSRGGNRALHRAGIRASMHQFRHRYATAMHDAGADVLDIQQALGHANIGTTQRYTKVRPERVLAAAARVPFV